VVAACSDPPCDRAKMVALSPMHPFTNYDLSCETHRALIREHANDYMRQQYVDLGPRPEWATP